MLLSTQAKFLSGRGPVKHEKKKAQYNLLLVFICRTLLWWCLAQRTFRTVFNRVDIGCAALVFSCRASALRDWLKNLKTIFKPIRSGRQIKSDVFPRLAPTTIRLNISLTYLTYSCLGIGQINYFAKPFRKILHNEYSFIFLLNSRAIETRERARKISPTRKLTSGGKEGRENKPSSWGAYTRTRTPVFRTPYHPQGK